MEQKDSPITGRNELEETISQPVTEYGYEKVQEAVQEHKPEKPLNQIYKEAIKDYYEAIDRMVNG